MRPLRLQIEGFTCFKDRQELDLSALELFAITGPMGAGKSSLLDAMMLALYGEVPRVGSRYGELISHGRDRMSLVLDFQVGVRRFRVTRVRRRTSAAQAQLEEITGGQERPIADKVRDVDREVQRCLGLPYEAFTQAVVLPQGDFMKFLKSEPRKRREILRELLRHRLYENMRRLAAEHSTSLEQEVANLERRLAEDFGDATQEAVDELRARVACLAEEVRVADAELGQRRTVFEDLRARHGKTRELVGKREEVRTLGARTGDIEATEQRIDAARRAAPVVPVVRAAEEALGIATRREAQAKELQEAVARIVKAHQAAGIRLASAERAAEDLPMLRARTRALDEVKGIVDARGAVRVRLKQAEGDRGKCDKDLRNAAQKDALARERVHELKRAAQGAEAEVQRIGYDAGLDTSLAAVHEAAATLRELRRRASDQAREAGKMGERAARAEEAATRHERAAAEVRRQAEAVALRLVEAEQALRDAERRSAALLLRQELHVGEPCPVCEQTIGAIPRRMDHPGIEALRAARNGAREEEKKGRGAAVLATTQAAEARATATALRGTADSAARDAEDLARKVAQQDKELEEGVGPAVAVEVGTTVEARVLAAAQRIAGLRRKREDALATQRTAEKTFETARMDAERTAQLLVTFRERLEQLTSQGRDAKAEIERLDEVIAKVTRASDPLAERGHLAERQDGIEHELAEARGAHQGLEAQLVGARAHAAAAQRVAVSGREEAEKSLTRALEAARAAGFDDEQVTEAAALPDREIADLEAGVAGFRRELHAVQQRVEELARELAGQEVSDTEVRTAESGVAEQEGLVARTRDEKTGLERDLATLVVRVDRAASLRRERHERRNEYAVYRRLADDLRSERFQAFVLGETFRELAQGASQRLMALSGRYTFEYRGDTFYVVDHDNACEQRSADTLSGGETFLASLALALELSEQIQRAAGAVPLDSLFIDEGFGTLDPVTLDTVAAAIQSLPVGGRMVGIITHVRELAESLPARIVVEKGSSGSRVEVEVE